jgi:hypothetical protein
MRENLGRPPETGGSLLGNGEVESSILSRSTSHLPDNPRISGDAKKQRFRRCLRTRLQDLSGLGFGQQQCLSVGRERRTRHRPAGAGDGG